MKKFTLLFSLIVVFVTIGFLSYSKGKDDGGWVDITNLNDLQNSLKIPQSQNLKGASPRPTTGNNGLQSTPYVGVTSCNTIILPIHYSSHSDILKVFLQVDSAEGHITVSTIIMGELIGIGTWFKRRIANSGNVQGSF